MILSLFACTDPGDTGIPEPPDPEFAFSIAAIADPHIAGGADALERLASTVAWIDEHAESRGIDLVVVLGDIGWGEPLQDAHDTLEELDVPYVPVIGDNEPHAGWGEGFDQIFAEQLLELEELGEDWTRMDIPVWDPEAEETIWLQNYGFTYRGMRLVVLDWASRSDDTVIGETGDLHDFEGGTLAFLSDELSDLHAMADESVVMATHNPMFLIPGGFDIEQSETVYTLTSAVEEKVAMNLAGHFHVDYEETIYDGGYELYIVDAVWDDLKTIRLVEVWDNGETLSYEHELVIVP